MFDEIISNLKTMIADLPIKDSKLIWNKEKYFADNGIAIRLIFHHPDTGERGTVELRVDNEWIDSKELNAEQKAKVLFAKLKQETEKLMFEYKN